MPSPKAVSLRFQVSERDFASMGVSSNRSVSMFFPFTMLGAFAAADHCHCRLDVPRPWITGARLEDRPSLSSLSSTQSNASKFSIDSLFSRRPSVASQSSISTFTSHETPPTLIKTPWEAERAKNPRQTRRKLSLSTRFFQLMPPEIYDCILRQLEVVHLDSSLTSCGTCFIKDLCSLALASKSWSRPVRSRMYGLLT